MLDAVAIGHPHRLAIEVARQLVKLGHAVHLTTTDISLELLLGPQLSAFAAAGYEVIGVSAPGPTSSPSAATSDTILSVSGSLAR